MELLVYKASAGSGKTFTLAVEYIKHLIANPRAYRQILAVTFTNKATGEMKERIVQQLYGIWKGDRDSEAYLNRIREDLKDRIPTEDRMRVGRLIENMTGGTALVESMHGAGSPQAQRIMIARQGNIQGKKKLAKNIAGIQK